MRRTLLITFLLFACVLAPLAEAAEDEDSDVELSPSYSCGGDGYGYTASVEEDLQISEDGKFPNGTAIPQYSGEPKADGLFCTSAKECCSGRCINHKCCAPGKRAVGMTCVKGSQCCSRQCVVDEGAGATAVTRCCPRGTLAPGATCVDGNFCCQGSCTGGTCCLNVGALCDATGTDLCCAGTACNAGANGEPATCS